VEHSRRLCVAVDVEGYSRRSVAEQRSTQTALRHVLDEVWSGIAADRQPNGDGEVALAPCGADETAVLAHILTTLDSTCSATNLRLRAAAHAGHAAVGANGFVGHAVVRTCRMLHAAALRHALADDPAPSGVALLVSESLFEDVVALEASGLVADQFRPIDIHDADKRFSARTFLRTATPQSTRSAPIDPPTALQVLATAVSHVDTIASPGLRRCLVAAAAVGHATAFVIDAAVTFSFRVGPPGSGFGQRAAHGVAHELPSCRGSDARRFTGPRHSSSAS
jgi:hypothetical protein